MNATESFMGVGIRVLVPTGQLGNICELRDCAANRSDGVTRELTSAFQGRTMQIQIALAKVARAMGVKEFAAKVRMASLNLLRALNPRHNPTQDTLNRLLKPFRLKLSLAPIDEPKGRHAA